MKTPRTRFQLFLREDLAREVERLARQPGTSKSAILEHAVATWLRHRATREMDDRLAVRLDRFGRAQEEMPPKLDRLIEALETFVLYNLTLTADHEPFDAERAQRGRDMFAQFTEAVERKLAARAAASQSDDEDTIDGT